MSDFSTILCHSDSLEKAKEYFGHLGLKIVTTPHMARYGISFLFAPDGTEEELRGAISQASLNYMRYLDTVYTT